MKQAKTIDQVLNWWRGTDSIGATKLPEEAAPGEPVDEQLESELGQPDCRRWQGPRLILIQMIYGVGMTTPGGREAVMRLGAGLKLDRNKTLIDFGAGLGGVGFTIGNRSGCRVIGLENEGNLVAAANKLSFRFDVERQASVKPMSTGFGQFKPSSVDAIVAKESLYAIPQRPAWFQAAARALKPEGQLAFTDIVPGRNPPGEAVRAWIAEEPQMPRPMRHGDIENALTANGFEVDRSEDVTEEYCAALVAAFSVYSERVETGAYDVKWKAWAVAEAAFWQSRLRALQDDCIRVHSFLARRTGALSIGDFFR
jgi:cyclopropane fatty-acyl-phospholipid synthase-like methyltransferase